MRPLFPTRTRALRKELSDANLPHLCAVQIPGAAVDDGEGGTSVDWEDLALLPCRVSTVGTATERLIAGQVAGVSRYLVTFERGTIIPLSARLRVVLGEEDAQETLYLDPHGANGPRSFESRRSYECSAWAAATPGGGGDAA